MNEIQVKEEKILLSFKEYWFLIPTTLTFLGCCDLYFYYSMSFDIDIFNHISAQEILTSFFSKNFLFIVILSFPVLNCFVQYKLMPKLPLTKSIACISILVLIALVCFFQFILDYSIVISIFTAIFVLLPFLDISSLSRYECTREVFVVIICTVLVFSIIYLLIIKCKAMAADVISSPSSNKVSFIYNGVKVETNDSIKYIGGTTSTVFLYHKSDSSVGFYERNRLDSFKIKIKLK
jgi:hypothetical protein